jgi:general secretion pathway protein L
MAHHILGIDLGAYSVKVIVLNPGFRHAQVSDFIERPVPPGDEPDEVRAARVLGQILREHKLDADTAYAAVAGDRIFIHILEFPFRNLRRAELEKAVGAELEGILPVDLEDMVFGFEALPGGLGEESAPVVAAMEPAAPVLDLGAPLPPGAPGAHGGEPAFVAQAIRVEDDEPTSVRHAPAPAGHVAPAPAGQVVHGRVAAPTTGLRVLACAMEIERARGLLDVLRQSAMEPRGLVAAPASYARVIERITRLGGERSAAGPVAIIDIGHRRTDICVVKDGKAAYARTIARGGHHLTETISRAWRITYDEAQRAKHTDGFIGSPAEPPQTEQWQRIHEVVVAEMGPLAGDIKRTLSSCRAKTGASATQVLLVGGGSRLRGLASYLTDKLHIPVTTLDQKDADEVLGAQLASVPVDVACLAAGVAFEGSTGRPHFDLRQGELAYKADLSFLRQKATALAAGLLVLVAFAMANGFAALYELRADEQALGQRLAVETTEVFGAQLSAAETLNRTQGTVAAAKSPLPKMSAYDVLLEINSQLPDGKAVQLDVREVDIKAGKITLKATVHSAAQIDEIEEQLKKVDCFKVSRGNTSVGADDLHEFSFTINSTCM